MAVNKREEILNKIRELAKTSGGKPPGRGTFERETGIGESEWCGKIWARWGDAVAEAGFKPNTRPAKIEHDSILKNFAVAYQRSGKILTNAEMKIFRRNNKEIPADITIRKSFPTKQALLNKLANWLQTNSGYEDVAAMLADQTANPEPEAKGDVNEGYVYLLQSGGLYRIGRSEDIERRMKEHRVALPEKVVLAHTIRTDDPSGIEAYWHRRFKDQRTENGDWFRLTRSDVAAFKRRKFQ